MRRLGGWGFGWRGFKGSTGREGKGADLDAPLGIFPSHLSDIIMGTTLKRDNLMTSSFWRDVLIRVSHEGS